ncbi:CMRF35-like molecule 1 isoform X1 [Panthera pardus]|uniref:CMRF35-like molecule 1 isoform X1 n=1 Tax=Panthera pardus TaxID=9691 RepID=A0A9W2URH6_PANPR|nr:CMRF35-like molecule 1 isoform X1 [Panthera pardus]
MITVTCFIARCLEISPVLPPSAFCLFTGGKWPKEEVQEREKAEGLEDAGAESELTGSTKGGPGKDKMHGFLFLLFLFQLAGSSDISGPEAVRGLVGGSLTVQCHYVQKWKNSKKWWCRGANWGNCHILVKTNGSEQEVQRKNVSIKDNQKNLIFTVTMEKLKQTDANIYWCGIERYGIDLGVKVKVTVHPAPTTVSTTSSNAHMSTTPAETKGPSTMTSHHYDGSADSINLSILLPLIFAVLLLLLVAASLLALRMMKQQKKAAEPSPGQVMQPLEGDLCYANLTLQPTGTSHGSSQKACTKPSSSALENQQEVDYITMASFPKENISYAALSWELLDQEPTYSSTDVLVTHVPRRNPEESMEYSTIRKP